MKWLLSSKAWAVVIPADFLPTFLFLWTAYSTAEQMSCGKRQSMKKPLSRERHKHTRPGSSWQTVHGFWVNFTYTQGDQEMQNAHLACSWIWEITAGRYWWYVNVNEIGIIALSIISKYTWNFSCFVFPDFIFFPPSLLARSHCEGDGRLASMLLVFLSQKAHCFHLNGFFTILFYVYRCFAYMSVHYMCIVPEDTRREWPLGWS